MAHYTLSHVKCTCKGRSFPENLENVLPACGNTTSLLGQQTSMSAYQQGFNPSSGVPPPGSVGNHSGIPGPPMTRQPQPMPGPMPSPMGGQQAKRIDPNQMPNPVSFFFFMLLF